MALCSAMRHWLCSGPFSFASKQAKDTGTLARARTHTQLALAAACTASHWPERGMADLGQLQRVANFLGIGSRQKKPPSPDRGVVGVGVLGASQVGGGVVERAGQCHASARNAHPCQGPWRATCTQVATYALLAPARQLSTAEVVAVAARDAPRARQYARQHWCAHLLAALCQRAPTPRPPPCPAASHARTAATTRCALLCPGAAPATAATPSPA